MTLKTLFTFSMFLIILLPPLSAGQTVVDFCVANLSLPKGPAGYPCRNPATVTADDFVYRNLNIPTNTTRNFNYTASLAFDDTFPGLNGQGISIARLVIAVSGSVPLHAHRVSALLLLVRGTVIAGFFASDDIPYYTTLNEGDVFIFPPSLPHFIVNDGSTPAICYVSSNSANPGSQVIPTIFGSSLPSELIVRTTLLSHMEVQKFRRLFAVGRFCEGSEV